MLAREIFNCELTTWVALQAHSIPLFLGKDVFECTCFPVTILDLALPVVTDDILVRSVLERNDKAGSP